MIDHILTLKELAVYLKLLEETTYKLAAGIFLGFRWVETDAFKVNVSKNG
jgi:hypothetical protein